tara:strand:+ start:98179 stop:99105 length:927 start_codon:yes stop_codon:yes gene_type:complete
MKKLIGHLDVQKQLNQLFETGRVPHAIMLHGAKGIGKRLIAEAFARRLLCGPSNDLLGGGDLLTFDEGHELFPQIEAASTPDYLLIEPEEGKKEISVKIVREKLKNLSLSSDGKRIVIIDAADQMNSNSANALLKTLEEPGEGVHIILIAHSLSNILPTIVSRCRQFRVSNLTNTQVAEVLKTADDKKTPVEIDILVELAAGCPGEALRLGKDGEDILKMIDTYLSRASTLEAINLSEKFQQKKVSPLALELLLKRIAMRAKSNPQNAHKWAQIYQNLDDKRRNMEIYNLSPQLVLETCLMDVISTNS